MQISLRDISSYIFNKPSKILEEINTNALMEQWLVKYPSPKQFVNRYDMYEYVNDKYCGGGVDFLEFGVASGVSLSYWVTMNKKAESRFYGFDTFEGLPEAFDRIRYTDPVGTFSVNGSLPNIDDHRAKLIKGLFQNTLSKFKNNYHSSSKRLIIHNDSDLYSSSLYLMTMLDELIITGTILIFDEFFCSSHEFKAFYDYTRSYNKSYKVVASTPRNGSRYIQVAIEIL